MRPSLFFYTKGRGWYHLEAVSRNLCFKLLKDIVATIFMPCDLVSKISFRTF